jgi:CheY-like chemotaxis protein
MVFLRREGIFARAPQPDLILLDIELPKKDGRQVLAEIRADSTLESIPVVVLTGSLVHQTIFQSGSLHVDGFMAKPVSLDQFIRVIKSLHRSWLTERILPALDQGACQE